MIIDFLQKNENVAEMVQQLGGFLTHWLPMFEAENRSYPAVGIGCTVGRYHSVYIANRLVTTFWGRGRPVQWRHQDLQRLSSSIGGPAFPESAWT